MHGNSRRGAAQQIGRERCRAIAVIGRESCLAIDPLWFDDAGVLHGKATRETDEPAP